VGLLELHIHSSTLKIWHIDPKFPSYSDCCDSESLTGDWLGKRFAVAMLLIGRELELGITYQTLPLATMAHSLCSSLPEELVELIFDKALEQYPPDLDSIETPFSLSDRQTVSVLTTVSLWWHAEPDLIASNTYSLHAHHERKKRLRSWILSSPCRSTADISSVSFRSPRSRSTLKSSRRTLKNGNMTQSTTQTKTERCFSCFDCATSSA